MNSPKQTKQVVTLTRRLIKRPSVQKLLSQLQQAVGVAMKGGRGRGWTTSDPKISEPVQDGGEWVFTAKITFTLHGTSVTAAAKYPAIVRRMATTGCAGPFRTTPWTVIDPPGYTSIANEAKAKGERNNELKVKADEPKELGHYSLEPKGHFKRLFGREAQLRRIMDAFNLADRTGFGKRTHSLLDGPPGCGKSEIMLALSRMLGEENEAWMWYDATSMTKAGVIEGLMEAASVPPFLFIEEIEKCPEEALRWLLGVMDVRGIIRRTNYRVGNQARAVRMVVTATANDVRLLKGVMSGALFSRFQNNLYCPPPDRDIMRMILDREMAEMRGKAKWIEPALIFAFDKWVIRDPRTIITICSCGGDRLLDGSYQADFEKTMHPAEKRVLLKRKERFLKAAQRRRIDKEATIVAAEISKSI